MSSKEVTYKAISPDECQKFIANGNAAIATVVAKLWNQTEDPKMKEALGMVCDMSLTIIDAQANLEIPVMPPTATKEEAKAIMVERGALAIAETALGMFIATL